MGFFSDLKIAVDENGGNEPEYVKSGNNSYEVLRDGELYGNYLKLKGAVTVTVKSDSIVVIHTAREGIYSVARIDSFGKRMKPFILDGGNLRKKYVVPGGKIMDNMVLKPVFSEQEFVQIDRDIALVVDLDEFGEDVIQFIKAGGYINVTNPDDIYGVPEHEFNNACGYIGSVC